MTDSSEIVLSVPIVAASSIRPSTPSPVAAAVPIPVEVSTPYQEKASQEEVETPALSSPSPAEESFSESRVLLILRGFAEVVRDKSLVLFGNAVRIVSARPLPVAITSAVLLVLIFVVSYFVSHRPDPAEIALAAHAQQLEQQKNWPEALTEYEKLAGLNDSVGAESRDHAGKLKSLIDQENSLFAKAKSDESISNSSEARQLYQEAADLHGDQEQQALAAVARLTNALNSSAPSPGNKSGSVPQPKIAGIPQAPVQPSIKTAALKCDFLPSDYAKMLDRADTNLANGHYKDAKRQYNSVLACDSKNERARTGLDRAIKAERPN